MFEVPCYIRHIICPRTEYPSQGQRSPRAPWLDKQNAINVSGNESKLENVYMGIKIVKNVFWTFVKFYILSINPSKWTFSTSAIENTVLWSCKGSKKSDLYFLYIKYFTVSCGIYSLLKFAYFTHGWFRPKLIDQKLLPTMKAILIQSDVYEL